MSSPRRWIDDTHAAPAGASELLRSARRTRPLDEVTYARSAARVARLGSVATASASALWLKALGSAAAMGIVGVVAVAGLRAVSHPSPPAVHHASPTVSTVRPVTPPVAHPAPEVAAPGLPLAPTVPTVPTVSTVPTVPVVPVAPVVQSPGRHLPVDGTARRARVLEPGENHAVAGSVPTVPGTAPGETSMGESPVGSHGVGMSPNGHAPGLPGNDLATGLPGGGVPAGMAGHAHQDAIRVETDLLDQARATLTSQPEETLRRLTVYDATCPHGQLSDLREYIALEANQRLGRTETVRSRGTAFLETWPRSLYASAVRDAVRRASEARTSP